MIAAGHLAPFDQWDQAMVTDLLDGNLYPHGLKFRWHMGFPNTDDTCVLLTPGRYWAGHEDEISEATARYPSLLLIVTGDEEGLFDCAKVIHPSARYWIQTPRQGKQYPEDARFFGVGYTPHMRDLPADPPIKDLDVFLSCQRTHDRREQAFRALEDVHCFKKYVVATEGFTQGISPADYAASMVEARVAPCPSGAVSPDSFRLWEALEAHCIPIGDSVSPVDGVTDYWQRIFGDVPFPVCVDWSNLPGWVDDLLAGWPANANRVAAFWMRYKRSLALDLVADLRGLGAL